MYWGFIKIKFTLYTYVLTITKWCKVYTKFDSWFQKSHEEFGQLQTSTRKSKKLKSDGLLLSKNKFVQKYIPSAKTLYTEYLTFNYLCENSPNYLCHYITFYNTTPLFLLAQTLHNFYKSSPSKCKFLDFLLLGLKFTKFLM